MKNLISILAFSVFTAITFTSCTKKTDTPTPASTPIIQRPTIDVEFFVNANEYSIREPYDYPNGSPTFKDLTNTFHNLGTNDVCLTTGKKITIKYSTTDTTLFAFWFYNDATPTATFMGGGNFKITKTGDVIQSYGTVPGSSSIPYFATCKKAMVLN